VSPARLAGAAFVVATLYAACTPYMPCSNMCAGCCDVDDHCRTGTLLEACGTSGNHCVACNNEAQCIAGQCIDHGTGGGSGQACDITNCSGCCAPGGICVPPSIVFPTCVGGVSCSQCQGGTGGGGGGNNPCAACTSGCCDAQGVCQPGNTDAHCGVGGAACATCQAPAQTCSLGVCFGGATGGGAGGGGGKGTGGGAGGGSGLNCTLLPTSPQATAGAFDSNVTIAYSRSGGSPFNQVTYELWWSGSGPAFPYTETFQQGSGWASCTACVTYYEGCTDGPRGSYPEATCSGRGFLAQAGSFTVGFASQASSGSMDGGTMGLLFLEWDFANDVGIDGGACLVMPGTDFNVSY
jgi:hypothetical protein